MAGLLCARRSRRWGSKAIQPNCSMTSKTTLMTDRVIPEGDILHGDTMPMDATWWHNAWSRYIGRRTQWSDDASWRRSSYRTVANGELIGTRNKNPILDSSFVRDWIRRWCNRIIHDWTTRLYNKAIKTEADASGSQRKGVETLMSVQRRHLNLGVSGTTAPELGCHSRAWRTLSTTRLSRNQRLHGGHTSSLGNARTVSPKRWRHIESARTSSGFILENY